jgi:hypothetical protein
MPVAAATASPPLVTTSAPTTSAPALAPGPRFSGVAAQRALDATWREVLRCKRGRLWGVGQATVVFANDGTVDHIIVGPPFTGTPTGDCVGDAMSGVHVPPFGGRPAVFVTRFFVER